MQNTENKQCIVCTMLLLSREDYPNGDTDKNYCKNCRDIVGLHPYKKLVQGMAEFMQETQGVSLEDTKKEAKAFIDKSEAVQKGLLSVSK